MYQCQTMLHDIEINVSSYDVIKVDMVHENLKDLKLEVPPYDMTLTMRDAVTRRVQWRQTSINVNPSAAASASTTPSQPNTSPASYRSLIREQLRRSPIQDQPRRSPSRTRGTPLHASGQP
jgi:hypothetical protein